MAEEEIDGFPMEEGEFDEEIPSLPSTQSPYKLCNIKDAEIKMNEKIESIKSMIEVPYDNIILLLQYYKWNNERLIQDWTDDATIKKALEKAGIPPIPTYNICKSCPICGSDITQEESVNLPCGHSACRVCVSMVVSTGVKSNEASFSCWECKYKIPLTAIKNCLPKPEFDKFMKCLIRSYTNESKTIRWCPNRGCEYYCEFPDMLAQEIRCYCEFVYCFKCGKESHKPAVCTNRSDWDGQNSNDDEKLLESFAKKCPKCHVYIDKNGGCFQMTCFKCHHQFCWMCLQDWSTHSNHFACLKFPNIKVDNVNADQIKKAEEQVKSFYYERYIDQQRSKTAAEAQHNEIKSFIDLFCDHCKFHQSELKFLEEAGTTIINSRRILANTYIEMYYCKDEKEKNLIQYLMERLQFMCDGIQKLTEKKKDDFFDDDEQHRSFFKYKDEVIAKTSALKDALNNFEGGVESGYTHCKN